MCSRRKPRRYTTAASAALIPSLCPSGPCRLPLRAERMREERAGIQTKPPRESAHAKRARGRHTHDRRGACRTAGTEAPAATGQHMHMQRRSSTSAPLVVERQPAGGGRLGQLCVDGRASHLGRPHRRPTRVEARRPPCPQSHHRPPARTECIYHWCVGAAGASCEGSRGSSPPQGRRRRPG